MEKDNEGNLRDHYVGPLDKIIETILRLGARGNPQSGPAGI
ncbi:MAG: putative integrase [Sulfolobaceae archaeon]|nr:putative integrase [Sulfolobaceae archaeon]